MAQRPDGETVFIHVCEHPTPVAELRRIHDTISGTLGHRPLQRYAGSDVAQLKIILHALGYLHSDLEELPRNATLRQYDGEAAAAVDAFRADRGLTTPEMGTPAGWVDAATVDALWQAQADAGRAVEVRRELRSLTRIRR